MVKFSFILSIFFDRFGSPAGDFRDSFTGYGGSQMGLLMCSRDTSPYNTPDAVPFVVTPLI